MSWDRLPLDTPLGTLSNHRLAISGTDLTGRPTVVILRVGRGRRGRVPVSYMETATRNDHPPKAVVARVPAEATLAQFSLGFAQVRADHAGTVPQIRGLSAPVHPAWTWVSAGLPALAVVWALDSWERAVVVALLVLIFTLGLTAVLRRLQNPAVPRVLDGGNDVLPSEVARRISGEVTSGPSPQERVDVVKDAYGALHGDIVYRIECSALFDPAVASTQRFQLALLAWDPSSPRAAELASEVEVSFAEARSHAEQLGWSHLPETARDTAQRAQRAASLALASDSPGERRTAAARAAKLLASLRLYYLPVVDPDAPALMGERRQIGPA